MYCNVVTLEVRFSLSPGFAVAAVCSSDFWMKSLKSVFFFTRDWNLCSVTLVVSEWLGRDVLQRREWVSLPVSAEGQSVGVGACSQCSGQALDNSVFAFTSCLGTALRRARGESVGLSQIFPTHLHSPGCTQPYTWIHTPFQIPRNVSELFTAPYGHSIPQFFLLSLLFSPGKPVVFCQMLATSSGCPKVKQLPLNGFCQMPPGGKAFFAFSGWAPGQIK